MFSLTTDHCLNLLEELVDKGRGTKIILCEGDSNEAEKWRLRVYRAMKSLPETIQVNIYTERKKVGKDKYILSLHYLDEEEIPRFKIILKNGTVEMTKTPDEKRMEKMKEEEEDDNLDWNKDE